MLIQSSNGASRGCQGQRSIPWGRVEAAKDYIGDKVESRSMSYVFISGFVQSETDIGLLKIKINVNKQDI